MSPIQEAQWVCVHEVRRNLRSWKGVAMTVLFLLGGSVSILIYVKISQFVRDQMTGGEMPEVAKQALREKALSQLYPAEVAHYLSFAPPILLVLFKATLVLIPLLTLLIGFDQISGDMQARTFRYLAIRARRASIIVGKALAIWAVVSALILLLHVFVWGVCLFQKEASVVTTLSWGARFWAFSSVYSVAYVGVTALASSLTRRPVLSLFLGLIVVGGLSLGELIATYASSVTFARYLFPGAYDTLLIAPQPAVVVGGLMALLAYGVLLVAASVWAVNRSDI